MKATLNINQSVVAFGDPSITNNPIQKYFDWTRNLNGLDVSSPRSEQFIVPPQSNKVVFNGARSTFIDGTTTFNLMYVANNTYRFLWVGGTDPGFETNRLLSFNTTFQVTVNANQSVTITDTISANAFSTVAVGDTVYIFSTLDDPTAKFSAANAGFWSVLGVGAGGASVTLTRPVGTDFSAINEVVSGVPAASNMLAFNPANIQAGDKLRIDGGFSVATQGTYEIVSATSHWVDVVNTAPLPNQMYVAPSGNMVLLSRAKTFVRIEVDQRASIFLNNDVDAHQEIDPWVAADQTMMGWEERCGPVWAIKIQNLSTSPMTVNLFSVE